MLTQEQGLLLNTLQENPFKTLKITLNFFHTEKKNGNHTSKYLQKKQQW